MGLPDQVQSCVGKKTKQEAQQACWEPPETWTHIW